MSSGVGWDEDYADPQSDIAQTGGSALSRLRYLLRQPRVAPPGSTFNYNTEETNLVGAVLRAAIGNNLTTYLDDRIWRRFGMEHDATWLLLSESGAEHGGCCLSATLRDYGRLGLFAMRNGRLADGPSVLPEGWMDAATTASATNVGYGLLWWLRRDRAFAAIGIYGQAIYINPPCGLLVGTHSAWPRATDREPLNVTCAVKFRSPAFASPFRPLSYIRSTAAWRLPSASTRCNSTEVGLSRRVRARGRVPRRGSEKEGYVAHLQTPLMLPIVRPYRHLFRQALKSSRSGHPRVSIRRARLHLARRPAAAH